MPPFLTGIATKVGAVVAIVVALVIYRAVLVHRIDKLTLTVANDQTELVAEKANVASLLQTITRQNDALAVLTAAELKAETDQQAAEAKATLVLHTAAIAESKLMKADAGKSCEEGIRWASSVAPSLSSY